MNPFIHLLDDALASLRSWEIADGICHIGRTAGLMPGASPGIQIQIGDHFVAPLHACIWLRPDGEPVWFLEDLGSQSGTYANDVRIEDLYRLRDGDIIQVGKTRLLFELKELIGAA